MKRSIIRNDDDVGGQERVTRDEERRAYFSQPIPCSLRSKWLLHQN